MHLEILPQENQTVNVRRIPYLKTLDTCPSCKSDLVERGAVVYQDVFEQVENLQCPACGLLGYVSTQITFSEEHPHPEVEEPFALTDADNVTPAAEVSAPRKNRRKKPSNPPSMVRQIMDQLSLIERMAAEFLQAQKDLEALLEARRQKMGVES